MSKPNKSCLWFCDLWMNQLNECYIPEWTLVVFIHLWHEHAFLSGVQEAHSDKDCWGHFHFLSQRAQVLNDLQRKSENKTPHFHKVSSEASQQLKLKSHSWRNGSQYWQKVFIWSVSLEHFCQEKLFRGYGLFLFSLELSIGHVFAPSCPQGGTGFAAGETGKAKCSHSTCSFNSPLESCSEK